MVKRNHFDYLNEQYQGRRLIHGGNWSFIIIRIFLDCCRTPEPGSGCATSGVQQ
ncbi:hypothetical protein [Peribacillus loiseleuriae]|uniref:hypothetical protein n=1 Tax=Peribacillus loiseleuriae TaxID=1679170 RepID=UPI0012E281D1|nr:hypothetical protein [Peribacillus loiseleuriae]